MTGFLAFFAFVPHSPGFNVTRLSFALAVVKEFLEVVAHNA